jgi:hypothetical protein
VRRRYRVALVAAALVAAGALAAGIVLASAGSGKHGQSGRAEYLTRVEAICQRYGRQLDRIPPPADIAIYGEVLEPVRTALPVLKAQQREIRRLQQPRELKDSLARFFALSERSIAGLELTLRGIRAQDLGVMGRGELQFARARDEAKAIARRIGFRC